MNIDINKIKELVDLINSSNLTALEVQDGPLKIRLEKSDKPVEISLLNNNNNTSSFDGGIPAALSKKNEGLPDAEEAPEQLAEKGIEEVNCKVIKAPMVGAYHNLPTSDIGPGTKLKKGDRVCIIEAMKLMNEITMEEDGEIVSMEVREGEMVEYGQVLVKYK
jgi:acetyl-CoA carboxylase biotin carboxyl carrier protein